MTSSRRRRHSHLSRETIAATALSLIDDQGVDALSLRNIAERLGVGTMTLYQHVGGREDIVDGVVTLILAEVDLSPPADADWAGLVRRIAVSLRSAALRHPRAWILVATASSDRQPLLDYAGRVRELDLSLGIPPDDFGRTWAVTDSFLAGFLLLETQRIIAADRPDAHEREEDVGLLRQMQHTLSDESFAEALDVILDGLCRRYGR
jgi:AcrR family transcriptional regulator